MTGAKRGEMVADFCAGAGGKTLALGAMMRNTGRLYAFDVSGHRLAALKPRLARSGLSNVYPVQIAHERDERIKRLAGKLDRVLVDAPCSGLGTLRRNPDLKWRQSPKSVRDCASSRRRSSPARRACSSRAGASSTPPAACCAPRTRTIAAGLRRRAGRGVSRAAGRRGACGVRRSPTPKRSSRATSCACGRTGTAPTASSRRCGSVAEAISAVATRLDRFVSEASALR